MFHVKQLRSDKMNLPYNSNVPHFLQRAKAYCAKVLPLVFDNSLSYYEFLCKMCHKLNECIDAINSQNLNIIEFEKMVQLEMENFEKYMETRQTEFENEMKAAWAEFKAEMLLAWNEFKTQLETEWAEEREVNRVFRETMQAEFQQFKDDITAQQAAFEERIKADFETYKNTVNAEIEQFENTVNADMDNFKNTMQTQQNEFESHMTALFTDFTTDETAARAEFESRFAGLFDQWKIDTLNALTAALNDWKSHTLDDITAWENATAENFKLTIANEIHAFEIKFENEVSQLNRAIVLEKTERERVTADLQKQIDELEITNGNAVDTLPIDIPTNSKQPVPFMQGVAYYSDGYSNIFGSDGTLANYHNISDWLNDSIGINTPLTILYKFPFVFNGGVVFSMNTHDYSSTVTDFTVDLYAYPRFEDTINESDLTHITTITGTQGNQYDYEIPDTFSGYLVIRSSYFNAAAYSIRFPIIANNYTSPLYSVTDKALIPDLQGDNSGKFTRLGYVQHYGNATNGNKINFAFDIPITYTPADLTTLTVDVQFKSYNDTSANDLVSTGFNYTYYILNNNVHVICGSVANANSDYTVECIANVYAYNK